MEHLEENEFPRRKYMFVENHRKRQMTLIVLLILLVRRKETFYSEHFTRLFTVIFHQLHCCVVRYFILKTLCRHMKESLAAK